MPRRPWHLGRRGLAALAVASLWACNGKGGEETQRARTGPQPLPTLRFEGYVYVDADTSDFKILERVRQQTSSIFPSLRRSRVMVSRREVLKASVDSFKKEPVTVVGPAGARRPALRVRFRYVTRADVAPNIDDRLEIKLAALHRSRDADADRVLRECSTESPGDRRATSSLNLVFDATLDGCKAAIQAEQAAIDAATAALAAGEVGAAIPAEEIDRLYIPITVTLEVAAPPPDRPDAAPGRPAGRFPRYEPFDPIAAAAPQDLEPELDPTIRPAEVIVDPDLARPERGEPRGPGAPGAPGAGGARTPIETAVDRLPSVIAPPIELPQKKEVIQERFNFSFEKLLDPKFLAVWLSLFMAYGILRGERKKA